MTDQRQRSSRSAREDIWVYTQLSSATLLAAPVTFSTGRRRRRGKRRNSRGRKMSAEVQARMSELVVNEHGV